LSSITRIKPYFEKSNQNCETYLIAIMFDDIFTL